MVFGFIGKVVSKVFGYDKAVKQVGHSAEAIQGQVAASLNDMKAQITALRQEVVNKLIPEVTQTLDVARDSMQSLVNTTQQALERFSKSLDKIDDTVVTIKFGIEVILIILFLLIAMLCRYELNRIERILEVNPNAFYRLERELLHMLRLACIFSGLALVCRVFYILILQRTEATPNEILLLALLPILAVVVFKILCLLLILLKHVWFFLRFALWAPFMMIVYPVFYILHLTFIAPSIWLYRVYQARYRLRNQYAIYVMHSLVIVLPFFFIKMIDIISYVRGDDYSSHLTVLYALITTYCLYYLIALDIRLNYSVPPPQQKVRQVYAIRYPQRHQSQGRHAYDSPYSQQRNLRSEHRRF